MFWTAVWTLATVPVAVKSMVPVISITVLTLSVSQQVVAGVVPCAVAATPSFGFCPTGHANTAQLVGSTTVTAHSASASEWPPAASNCVARDASASALGSSASFLCPAVAAARSAKCTANSAVCVNTPPCPSNRRAAAGIFGALVTVAVTSTVLTERSVASIVWTAVCACSVVAWATKVAVPVTGTGVTAGSSSQQAAAAAASSAPLSVPAEPSLGLVPAAQVCEAHLVSSTSQQVAAASPPSSTASMSAFFFVPAAQVWSAQVAASTAPKATRAAGNKKRMARRA
mmetsp:Transcript_98425/g.263106  ORF Transcript_98425/g.263106 Transcript_98425/m.263106 type:complete len:286 (+) Transcript_98425:564-1421(+)